MYVGRGRTHPSYCIGASLQQFLYPIQRGVAKIKIPTLVYVEGVRQRTKNKVLSAISELEIDYSRQECDAV